MRTEALAVAPLRPLSPAADELVLHSRLDPPGRMRVRLRHRASLPAAGTIARPTLSSAGPGASSGSSRRPEGREPAFGGLHEWEVPAAAPLKGRLVLKPLVGH